MSTLKLNAVKAEMACLWCSKEFVPKRRDTRTCGASCRRLLNNFENNVPAVRKTVVCLSCKTEFLAPRNDSKVCGYLCLLEHRKSLWSRAQHDKTCEQCQESFIAGRSDKRFCSDICLGRNRRSRAEVKIKRCNYQTKRERLKGPQWPGGVNAKDWTALLNRYNNCCFYCETKPSVLTRDHVVPLSRGGLDRISNVVPACQSCNSKKSSALLVAWRIRRNGYSAWKSVPGKKVLP